MANCNGSQRRLLNPLRNSIRDLSAAGLTSRKSIILARDLATSALWTCRFVFICSPWGSVSIRDGTASCGRYSDDRGGRLKRRQRVNQSRTALPSKPPNRPLPRRRRPLFFFYSFSFCPLYICVVALSFSFWPIVGVIGVSRPPISVSHTRAHRHASPSPTHRRS